MPENDLREFHSGFFGEIFADLLSVARAFGKNNKVGSFAFRNAFFQFFCDLIEIERNLGREYVFRAAADAAV